MGIEHFDRGKRTRYRGDALLSEIQRAAARGGTASGQWGNHGKRRSLGWTWPGRSWRTGQLSGFQRWLMLWMASLFIGALVLMRSGYLPAGDDAPVADAIDTSWMRSAIDPPYVEPAPAANKLVWNGDADKAIETASVEDGSVSVHRGSAGAIVSARFALCHSGGGRNCVVDGDTFWNEGVKIRIADIDTPETHPARCSAEAAKGAAATRRLQTLLNAGPFSLEPADRDSDRYGRKLRIVTRDGASLGGVLVDEGLARWYGGGRRTWC